MPADLIVYGLVAAGLIFWLRNILGTRHGDETERPNPFAHSEGLDEAASKAEEKKLSPQEQIISLAEHPTYVTAVDNKTAENGLLEISRADRSFDINFFLEGAQEAFVIIVEAFAEGDRETLKELLSEDVYKAFEAAIDEREKNEQTQVTDIHAIRRAEIMEAGVKGKMALITVRFRADETSVTRDKDGEIVNGNPDRITEMRDLWTFGRDVKSKDPRWLVYETRSDIEEDNELVPNTDD